MSFLAPLFLLGGLAISLPILLHLIRRSSRERVPFSSLMFLMPTPPRVTRRSKLENVFLLILRCLVICLLAFAFARPYLSKPVAPDPAAALGQKTIVLIDTSASMHRGKLWSEAKDRAKTVLRKAAPADQVACFSFDSQVHRIMSFEQWASAPAGDRAALAAKQLDDLNPGWGATMLGPALISATEAFESTGKDDQSPKHIVVVTDLQEGSHLDGLQGFEWPRGLDVTVEVVQSGSTSNAGLQLASEQDTAGAPAAETGPRVRVINASDSKREQFQVGWRRAGSQEFVGATVDTYIPPGQSRVVVLPKAPDGTGFERVGLSGDEEDFDNTVYVVSPKPEQVRILFLGDDAEQNPAQPLYFLRRAFQDTRKLDVQVQTCNTTTALDEKQLAQSRLLIVDSSLPEEHLQAIRKLLDSDKAVLLLVTSASMAPTLNALAGTQGISIDEAPSGSYAMLSEINFEHPLLAPFADPRYSDFTKIHFWKHRRVNLDKAPGVRMIARFDTGEPALAELRAGKGKLWVLASGWQPEDSQLALSTKFVPLLYAMLEQSGAIKEQRSQYVIGETVTAPSEAEAVTIRKPDTSETKVDPGAKFTGTDQPGIYTVSSTQPPMQFAVNLMPEESKTAPLPIEELERLGLPMQRQLGPSPKQIQQRREHLQAVELENRQKLWRWLIAAALVILVTETWLAGRLTHRGSPAPAN
jgi:hypothetical protein